MRKKQVRTGRLSQRATFADVARMIAPSNAAPWLPAHLEWWAQGLRHDQLFDEYRPTKANTRERLEAVERASLLLQRELEAPFIRNLLDISKTTRNISIPIAALRDLSERAEFARSSPLLTATTGKTKSGRGKPKIPDLFDAKVLCAARVVELWLYFRKVEPGAGNLDAAAAAQAYWLASGGKSKGHGDPLNGWYDYFKIVRDQKGSAALTRLRFMWQQDLRQSERHGRPPWYGGDLISLPGR
jgi:hypothetical protein